jgi:hypothetical protein
MFRYHLFGDHNGLLVMPVIIVAVLFVVAIVVLNIAKRAGKKISPFEEQIADSLDAEDGGGRVVNILSAVAAVLFAAMILRSWLR